MEIRGLKPQIKVLKEPQLPSYHSWSNIQDTPLWPTLKPLVSDTNQKKNKKVLKNGF